MSALSDRVRRDAYVPEHLVEYVEAVSGAETHVMDGFVVYRRGDILTFVGYPLDRETGEKKLGAALRKALRKFSPQELHFIGEGLPPSPEGYSLAGRSRDDYFSLELEDLRPPPAVATMVRRALRELTVERGRAVTEDYRVLLAEFLSGRSFGEATQTIMEHIPDVVDRAESVVVIGARDGGGGLVAFDVADFSDKWAFYMFNVASEKRYVPGASDLLLHELIVLARERGKRRLNLGLGINNGVTFFKRKWGGAPFLAYQYGRYGRREKGLIDLFLERL